jgi:soluble lytic murein transglycosylase-like protein
MNGEVSKERNVKHLYIVLALLTLPFQRLNSLEPTFFSDLPYFTEDYEFKDYFDKAESRYLETYNKIIVLHRKVDRNVASRIAKAVTQISYRYNTDPDIIIAIMRIESRFDPDAVSTYGAIGLMQVMPLWLSEKSPCHGYDLWDIDQNIECGVQAYLIYLNLYGEVHIALDAYNRGPKWVNLDLRQGRSPHRGYSNAVYSVYSALQNPMLVANR